MKKIKIILLLTSLFSIISATEASAQVSIGIVVSTYSAPPPLPYYAQPPCPTDGYLWAPGYWAYGDGGYFWVPGVWVLPPQMGYLWTPGYWGYAGGMYGFHTGYWGPQVGFYGGINYGYGYGGSGFGGGRWVGSSFRYNTAVVNVNKTIIHNTYVDRTVVVNNDRSGGRRTSFNGGPGGISARPTALQESAHDERHIEATSQQVSHVQSAGRDKNQFASVNRGRPATTAMNTPDGHRYSSTGTVAHANNPHAAPVPNNIHSQPAPIQQQANSNHNNPAPRLQPQQQHYSPAPRPQTQPQHNNPAQATHQSQQQHNNPHQGGQEPQHNNPHQGGQQPQGGSPHPKDH